MLQLLCCKYLHKSYIKLKYEDEKRFHFPTVLQSDLKVILLLQ